MSAWGRQRSMAMTTRVPPPNGHKVQPRAALHVVVGSVGSDLVDATPCAAWSIAPYRCHL
ncbi:hypothetical protein E2562_030708 [Oryza meyeriana var. granulata]|uniref:Uncharacterized protein n=1 Tax=Oryza meyeriana var. granulata TaxID=110450 RepID=A0A6G1CVS7_9ORYZ|nr:hypothetical protein E2562_030708 [Oryza meyeriana var. granulata]